MEQCINCLLSFESQLYVQNERVSPPLSPELSPAPSGLLLGSRASSAHPDELAVQVANELHYEVANELLSEKLPVAPRPKKKHSVVIVPAPQRPVYAGVSLAHCSAAAQVAVSSRAAGCQTLPLAPIFGSSSGPTPTRAGVRRRGLILLVALL
jgi:hypothetical protein